MHQRIDVLLPVTLTCGFCSAHMTSGLCGSWASFLLKYDADGGRFRKLWRAAVNREPYYEAARLKQLKPEVLSKSFHLLRMEMKMN